MTPPPPPPAVGHVGPAPLMPASLQVMMREMQQKQPRFQQKQPMQQSLIYQGGRGRGGRHVGRGRGFQHQKYRRHQSDDQLQSKRKRRPSDEVRDASRFFLPSFLEDPWKALEGGNGNDRKQGDLQWKEEIHPRQVQHSAVVDNGFGRVLFQPSFLADPWVR